MIGSYLKNSAEFAVLLALVFTISAPAAASEWNADITKLLKILKKSETGEKLIKRAIEKAREQGLSGGNWLSAGDLSATDTILTRRFSKKFQKITYKLTSRVTVNQALPQDSAVLDLAHELTHFIFRQEFNPYSEEFNLEGFLKGTIESEGGEAHAFVMECKVGMELEELNLVDRSELERCWKYFKGAGNEISWEKVLKDFYALGRWYGNTLSELDQVGDVSKYPRLNSKESKFISAAAGVPYPLAAIREYKMVQQSACENDFKRLRQLRYNLNQKLSLESYESQADRVRSEIADLQGSLKKRCGELRFSLSSDL
jgi:hypothetical protein